MSPQEKLSERQDELVKIIEAFVSLNKTKEWATLRELVFDRSQASIERQMFNEANAPEVNANRIYKLQGELAWVKKYSDLDRFIETLKIELENIKNQLK